MASRCPGSDSLLGHSHASAEPHTGASMSAVCPICLDVLTDPRLLPCLHTACRACIDRMVATAARGDRQVRCPICRSPCPVPNTGASELPENTISASRRKTECDLCGSVDTKAWCSTCDVFVCNEHLAQHMMANCKTGQAPAGHFFKTWVSSQEAHQAVTKNSSLTSCPKHGLPLEYFCESCDVLACDQCADEDHSMYGMISVKDCLVEKKRKVAQGAQKLRRDLEPRLVRSIATVGDVTTLLDGRAKEANEAIHAAGARVVEAVQLYTQQLLQQVEDVEHVRGKVLGEQQECLERHLDAVRGAASFAEEMVDVLAPNTKASLSLLIAVEKRIEALLNEKIDDEPNHHGTMQFRPTREAQVADVVRRLLASWSHLMPAPLTQSSRKAPNKRRLLVKRSRQRSLSKISSAFR